MTVSPRVLGMIPGKSGMKLATLPLEGVAREVKSRREAADTD